MLIDVGMHRGMLDRLNPFTEFTDRQDEIPAAAEDISPNNSESDPSTPRVSQQSQQCSGITESAAAYSSVIMEFLLLR